MKWHIVVSLVLVHSGFSLAGEGPGGVPKKKRPNFTVSKETTFITEALDEKGYPDYQTALNQILSKGIEPEKNANVLLWRAIGPVPDGRAMPRGFFKWLGMDAPPGKGDYFVGRDDFVRREMIEGEERSQFFSSADKAQDRPWTAKENPLLAKWLKHNEAPLRLVIEASKRPDYYAPLLGQETERGRESLILAPVDGVQACRKMGEALLVRSMLHLGEGRRKEAWRDLLTCHRLGRLIARGPTLIDGILGNALDMAAAAADVAFLEHGKLDEKAIRSCREDLQNLPPMPRIVESMNLSERFWLLEMITRIDRDGVRAFSPLKPRKKGDGEEKKKDAMDLLLAVPPQWDLAMKDINHWMDRAIESTRERDFKKRKEKMLEFDTEIKELKVRVVRPGYMALAVVKTPPYKGKAIGEMLLAVMFPAFHRVQYSEDNGVQMHRNLQVALALETYRVRNKAYPKTLDVLTPGFIDELPKDMFSGKSLIYRPQGNGYLLYSVGVNGQDDQEDQDGFFHDDLVIRMRLPARDDEK